MIFIIMRQWDFSKISKIVKTDFFTGISILVAAYLYISHLKYGERPIVSINNGKLRGILQFTRDYQKYNAFYGIPYAKPPVGDLRFAPPQPVENWDSIRDASYYRPQCISLELLFIGGVLFGDESCLYLNVFQKENRKTTGRLPVMVFFHGGMFHFGSAEDHGEKYIMDEEVIFVTVSYRLGALGFLSTGDEVVRGNNGLKDQVAALKWVQKNIHHFGGDPKQVTIFGESAGGLSVGLHLLSPLSKGLFHKAIIQSGATLSSWGVLKKSAAQAKRFAGKFDCPTENSAEMVKCLRKLDAKELVYGHMEGIDYFRTRNMIFSPTIEAVNDSRAFLTEDPLTILREGRFEPTPLIMGVTKDEGLLFSSSLFANSTKLALMSQFQLTLPITMQYARNDKITDKIINYYFDKVYTNGTVENLMQNLTNIFSDRHFFQPLTRTAKLYSAKAPLYLFYFNHSNFHSLEHFISDRESILHPIASLLINHTWRVIQEFILRIPVPGQGVCHGSELPLIFNHPWTPSIYSKLPDRDLQMSKDMVHLWASWARSWEPLMLGKVRWTPVEHGKPFKYLEISKTPAMIDEPFTDRVNFWESLVDELQEPEML